MSTRAERERARLSSLRPFLPRRPLLGSSIPHSPERKILEISLIYRDERSVERKMSRIVDAKRTFRRLARAGDAPAEARDNYIVLPKRIALLSHVQSHVPYGLSPLRAVRFLFQAVRCPRGSRA